MTCFVSGFKTKKAFKEAVEAGATIYIQNPSPFLPGTHEIHNGAKVDEIRYGHPVLVTNHPKRSWYAIIERKDNGKLVVK